MYLEQEIAEQPAVIRTLLNEEAENVAQIAQAIRDFDPIFVMIAARGTSDNAGRYAQYLMGIRADLPVALATPSVHTLYQSPPRLARALVIGISQSGQAEDVTQVISDAQKQGALTIGITNDPHSLLAQTAQHHIFLRTGDEKSIAATKTYTAQLTAIAMLGAALVNQSELTDSLQDLPDYVSQTLTMSENIPMWVERYRYVERFATIGRGYNYCTAFEISLKLKELCYLTGEEYSEADFRHGPIALIEHGFPVLTIAPKGKTLKVLLDLLAKLQEKQAECLVISNAAETHPFAKKLMQFPNTAPEWLSPICTVIPGQAFAMNLAKVKDYSVDSPRGLTKVTITQ